MLMRKSVGSGTPSQDQGRLRPVATVHVECFQLFQRLVQFSWDNPELRDDAEIARRLLDEFQRYQLWAGNVGAGHGTYKMSLDYRLEDATFYRDQVIGIIKVLQRHIQRAFVALGKPAAVASTSETEEEEDSESPYQSSSDSEISKTSEKESRPMQDLRRLVDYIGQAVSSLYLLQIRKPAPVDRLKGRATGELASYQTFDVMHVRAKFEGLDERVVSSLGKMITQRRQLLVYREKHQHRLRDRNLGNTVDLSIRGQSSGQSIGITEPHEMLQAPDRSRTGSSTPGQQSGGSQSEATKMVEKYPGLVFKATLAPPLLDDAVSTTSDNASSFTLESALEIPSRPRDDANEFRTSFECKYCRLPVEVRTDKAWKNHVLRDLQPYVCTFPGCPQSEEFFDDRKTWFEHETQYHRVEFFCNTASHSPIQRREEFEAHMSELHGYAPDQTSAMIDLFKRPSKSGEADCNLCGRRTNQVKSHVSRHLQHLALFAVPRADFDQDEVEEDADAEASSGLVNGAASPASETEKIEWSTTVEAGPFPVQETPDPDLESARCDTCLRGIKCSEPRVHCAQCDDYDLCMTCFAEDKETDDHKLTHGVEHILRTVLIQNHDLDPARDELNPEVTTTTGGKVRRNWTIEANDPAKHIRVQHLYAEGGHARFMTAHPGPGDYRVSVILLLRIADEFPAAAQDWLPTQKAGWLRLSLGTVKEAKEFFSAKLPEDSFGSDILAKTSKCIPNMLLNRFWCYSTDIDVHKPYLHLHSNELLSMRDEKNVSGSPSPMGLILQWSGCYNFGDSLHPVVSVGVGHIRLDDVRSYGSGSGAGHLPSPPANNAGGAANDAHGELTQGKHSRGMKRRAAVPPSELRSEEPQQTFLEQAQSTEQSRQEEQAKQELMDRFIAQAQTEVLEEQQRARERVEGQEAFGGIG